MKLTILSLFILMCSVAFSQQYETTPSKYDNVIDEVMIEQSFDFDDPIVKDARIILHDFLVALDHISKGEATDPNREQYFLDFNEALRKANELNLNLSMFQYNIEEISKMTH
ncbi:hypothetical protein ERX46_06870 [Brumimicrobium glaciale]|uniref:Tail specific protease N-terminal domain-containing protein n=1 Tax=Brumimicrobium glaciale TaxID=200475 RepID=A0A4Q4KP19_9FLAO|nr:hypothetical protein [Brumimicrobium glaciale]RYM35092.1 hypothetical protein ERX46_06870 [Brumimicrobium glaciale]